LGRQGLPTQAKIEKHKIIRPDAQSKLPNVCPGKLFLTSKQKLYKDSLAMVHKISGKHATSEISHLHFNDNEFTDIPDIANTLGQ